MTIKPAAKGNGTIEPGTHNFADLRDTLPVLHTLALSYCPAIAVPETLGLFALDARLAGVVRSASEPMLAQIRLAWWREVLDQPVRDRPGGDPLLELLACWETERVALGKLIDGWEALTVQGTLSALAIDHLASARGDCFGALSSLLGVAEDRELAAAMGRRWALADLCGRLSNPDERQSAVDLARRQKWPRSRLARPMRPLVVLHGLAARGLRRQDGLGKPRPLDVLIAMRLGLLGR